MSDIQVEISDGKVKERLEAVIDTFLERSEISRFRPLIEHTFKLFMGKVDEKGLVDSLVQVQTQLIPWLISGEANDAGSTSNKGKS